MLDVPFDLLLILIVFFFHRNSVRLNTMPMRRHLFRHHHSFYSAFLFCSLGQICKSFHKLRNRPMDFQDIGETIAVSPLLFIVAGDAFRFTPGSCIRKFNACIFSFKVSSTTIITRITLTSVPRSCEEVGY